MALLFCRGQSSLLSLDLLSLLSFFDLLSDFESS